MKINFVRAFLAASFCLGLSPAAAQTPGTDSVVVDLAGALRFALSENPTVQIADREIKRKQYAKQEQISGLFPTVSADGSYSRAVKKQVMAMDMNGQTNRIEVGTDNSWSGGFNLSLPLIAPSLWKTIQLSELDVVLSVEQARSSRIDLAGQVQSAYYSLLLARDSYQVLLASYRNAQFNARNTADKYEHGLASEFDKLRSEVTVKNMRPQLVTTENGIRLAEMQLKVLMGMDVDEPVIFAGSLDEYESQMVLDFAVLSRDTSLADNTALRQLDIQEQQLVKTYQLNRSAFLPSLSLSANYQWNSLNNDFRLGHYRWYPYSTVGLSLRIPIFEGRRRIHRQNQDKINIANLKLERENMVRSLQVSVNNALNNIETAIEEVGSNKESIAQAEKAYAIAQKRYEVGSGTLLELNDAEVALTQARLAYNQSIYDYLAARTDLETTLGKFPDVQE